MSTDGIAGVYVHLPFCDRICPYCDFAVVRFDRAKAERYIDALVQEIGSAVPPAAPVRTVFLGGGTSSALGPDGIDRVLGALFASLDITPGTIECTLEANPTRGADDIARWRAAGVTRVSVGVQSLDDGDLHRLGRDHTAEEALAFVRAARSAGVRSIAMDLIAGAPAQTPASFAASLAKAVDAGPDHLSIYGLTVEPGTPYAAWHARDPHAFPDDDQMAEMLAQGEAVLTGAGFRHYEISNFARPGHECEHNIGYWRQRDCAAFGLSACGYEDGVRYRNVRGFDEYCRRIEAGESPREDAERLERAARIGEAAMLALRTDAGIDDADFRTRFAVDAGAVFASARQRFAAAGLLEVDERGARLTARGRLLANEVCAGFLAPEMALEGAATR